MINQPVIRLVNGYNNQSIKLSSYNAPIPLGPIWQKTMHYTKPPAVNRVWPSMARLRIAARAIFGPPDIFK